MDNVINAFKPHFSAQVNRIVDKYGDWNIVNYFYMCREPVVKAIQSFLNLLTLGKINREKKKYGYDDFMHLWAVVELQNPNNPNEHVFLRIEKKSNHQYRGN